MLEENKPIELKDEELEKVSGGGSGTIPPAGITFTISNSVESGCYYSKNMDLTKVVYVCQTSNGLAYYPEKFEINENTGSWSSNKVGSLAYVDCNFLYQYPYVLNVTPY